MQTGNAAALQEHTIRMTERKRTTITGVEDVDCFNEQIVVLRTPLGMLTITGTNLNIAQVRQKYGIREQENHNLPRSENHRQPKCPKEKEAAIEEAMRYYHMI